jgi:Restriction endonuclease
MVQFPNHYCPKHFEHEAQYLANRQRWARKHSEQYKHKEKQYNHYYNTVTRNRNDNRSEQYKFYRSKQWVDLRQSVLNHDHYLCQYCKVIGKLTPNSKTVDHIIPIAFDHKLMASSRNLATICNKCHRLKTKWEQEYYGTGQGMEMKNVPEISEISKIVLLMHQK